MRQLYDYFYAHGGQSVEMNALDFTTIANHRPFYNYELTFTMRDTREMRELMWLLGTLARTYSWDVRQVFVPMDDFLLPHGRAAVEQELTFTAIFTEEQYQELSRCCE